MSSSRNLIARLAPLTGLAFVACFIGGVVASSPPAETASNATWVANYATHSKQVGHLVSGIMLVLAGLCLATFVTHLWGTVAAARRPAAISPLPVVAAAVTAACMSMGGILMGAESGMLLSSGPMPSPDFLRFGNDIGFAMVSIPGMLAMSGGLACLSVQAHAAGLFGRRMLIFSLIVATLLVAAFLFIPIAGLLLWAIVVSVRLLRGRVAVPDLKPALA
jgi:hypothetical protein